VILSAHWLAKEESANTGGFVLEDQGVNGRILPLELGSVRVRGMIEQLEHVLRVLFQHRFLGVDPTEHFDPKTSNEVGIARSLNAAFLVTLTGPTHPAFGEARQYLDHMASSSAWAQIAWFYLEGIRRVREEIKGTCERDVDFARDLKTLSAWVSTHGNLADRERTTERIWSVFCPEATGIRGREREHVEALRERRAVTITEAATSRIRNPSEEILLTSNVLLTLPAAVNSLDDLPLGSDLIEELHSIALEPQLYWYDHPIQLDGDRNHDEVVYGLRGLEVALAFEKARGNMPEDAKIPCLLSVSVTHRGLQRIARKYIQQQLVQLGPLKSTRVYVFTEADTQRMIEEVLAPAAERYLQRAKAREVLAVFGVDGEYAVHYSFLKAIGAFWSVFIQPAVRAIFKIDLDQVFPQEVLVTETGASAFEHLRTPLWGAQGIDSNGQAVDFGMIAGALVNQRDIDKSLFTPDIPFPHRELSPDEYIFFSALPQALSTEAEMMTRYGTVRLDGKARCLQRIHVTGGTTGILIDSLRRHRPFTPSFIGRAEDQAYILSVLDSPSPRLAYVHKDGLIMRHDKEAFAQEAIQSGQVGKLIGDYVRILYLSAYAQAVSNDMVKVKEELHPFTGCFISRIPITIVYLRLALKAASFFAVGKDKDGLELITIGAQRITRAVDFIRGHAKLLKQQYEKERVSWNLYYDVLSRVENALSNGDGFALDLRRKAAELTGHCWLGSSSTSH
jgi:hypothetical protein